ncbi:MAG: hypothetical protein IT168_25050 [Bryobacterales bacterium]|nr:hypothetical protein [Bryobacterales bacterium]
MDKTTPRETLSSRPIARKVLAKMKLHWQRKVVNLKNVVAGRAIAEELQKTIVSQKELAGFHPAHAAYVYTQNQVSVMPEQITTLKEMAPFADIISKAEDAECAPDEPVDHVLFHLLGVLRRLYGVGQRDYRHHDSGGRRRFRHAPRAVAPDPANAGLANGLLHSPWQRRRRERS